MIRSARDERNDELVLDERGLRYVVAGKIHEGPAVSERVVGACIHGNAAQQGVTADGLVGRAARSLWRPQLNAGTLGRNRFMNRITHDCSGETNPDLAAAQVAAFVLQACTSFGAVFRLLPATAACGLEELTRQLSTLQKPTWLEGHVDKGILVVRAGTPEQLNVRLPWDRPPYREQGAFAEQSDDDLAICFTESQALRIHVGAYRRYSKDYHPVFSNWAASDFGNSRYARTFGFTASETAHVARVIRIGSSQPDDFHIVAFT